MTSGLPEASSDSPYIPITLSVSATLDPLLSSESSKTNFLNQLLANLTGTLDGTNVDVAGMSVDAGISGSVSLTKEVGTSSLGLRRRRVQACNASGVKTIPTCQDLLRPSASPSLNRVDIKLKALVRVPLGGGCGGIVVSDAASGSSLLAVLSTADLRGYEAALLQSLSSSSSLSSVTLPSSFCVPIHDIKSPETSDSASKIVGPVVGSILGVLVVGGSILMYQRRSRSRSISKPPSIITGINPVPPSAGIVTSASCNPMWDRGLNKQFQR